MYNESGVIIILLISPIIGALIDAHIKLSVRIFKETPNETLSLFDKI